MSALAFASRHRTALLLLAALGLGVLAAVGARGYIAGELQRERTLLGAPVAKVQVVVAKHDLARGETVSSETMAVRDLPADFLSAGAVAADRFDDVVGGQLAQPMRAGEPLLHGAVVRPDHGGFSSKVRSGIRALTITVDEVNSLSGMLQPGDRIDLMLSVRMPGLASSPIPQDLTRPLMQNLLVLATGRQAHASADDRQARGFTAITIEVTPEQAQRLVVAQRSGKLTALLRNPGDHASTSQGAMDVFALLGMNPPGAVPPRRPGTEVIVGGMGTLRAVDRPAPAVAAPAPTVAPTSSPTAAHAGGR